MKIMMIRILLAISAAIMGCGGASNADTREPSANATDQPPAALGDEILDLAAFADPECTASGGKVVCEMRLQAVARCHDCARPPTVNVPSFIGTDALAEVWAAYLPEIQALMGRQPFQARPALQEQEEDEACFVREHAASTVLGAPYYEDVRYCMRGLRHFLLETNPPQPGIRIRIRMSLSVSKNPHQPYREPDQGEIAPYDDAITSAFFGAVQRACARLQGKLSNGICDLRSRP